MILLRYGKGIWEQGADLELRELKQDEDAENCIMRSYMISTLHVYFYERNLKCTKNLDEKISRKRPLGKPRRKWEDNIKIYVIENTQYRVQCQDVMNTVMKFRIS
jgi:hypothetical protein